MTVETHALPLETPWTTAGGIEVTLRRAGHKRTAKKGDPKIYELVFARGDESETYRHVGKDWFLEFMAHGQLFVARGRSQGNLHLEVRPGAELKRLETAEATDRAVEAAQAQGIQGAGLSHELLGNATLLVTILDDDDAPLGTVRVGLYSGEALSVVDLR